MRAMIISLILSLVLAAIGVSLALKVANRNVGVVSTVPVHPVTDPMRANAAALARKPAADLTLKDTSGQTKKLLSLGEGKPMFVYFIKDGCPCSVEAEPMMHELYVHMNPDDTAKIPFVGIINQPEKGARRWVDGHAVPYTVLCSPDCAAMKAYNAPNSVYCTLIDRQGRIVKQWPGWSRRILTDIVKTSAELLGETPKPFDTKYAPIEDSSGCSFYSKS